MEINFQNDHVVSGVVAGSASAAPTQVYGDLLTTTFIGIFSIHECMQILGAVWVLCLILKMSGVFKLFKKILGYFP